MFEHKYHDYYESKYNIKYYYFNDIGYERTNTVED
jgi:hypothetical protein